MKTPILLRLVAITMAFGLLFSCSEREEITDSSNDNQAVLKSKTVESGPVFFVTPTGYDDTDNIETALSDAAEAGPGSTVKFSEGIFYFSRGLKTTCFDGYINGAGKGKTLITMTPGEKIDGEPIEGWGGMMFSYLLYFHGGNIQMSDLSFVITDNEPAGEQYSNDWWQNALYCLIVIDGEPYTSVSSSFDNIGFTGSPGNFFGYNIAHAFHIFGNPYLDGGSHSLTNCDFKNMFVTYNGFCHKNSSFLIGGSPQDGNKFENTGYGPFLEDVSNSAIEISYNDIIETATAGSVIYQGSIVSPLSLELSKVLIHNNHYKIIDECDAIWIVDYGHYTGNPKMNISVYNNIMELETAEWYGGIWITSVSGAIITNNIISGNGYYGIYSNYGSGLFIKGNNLQNLNAQLAPILLSPATSNSMVIGGSNLTNVLDYGTDNILTGVNNMEADPIGPVVYDAMMYKKELLKTFKDLFKE